MSNKFEPLNPDEVVSVDKSAKILLAHPTFKVIELLEAAMFLFKSSDELTRKQGAVEKKLNGLAMV